MANSGPLTVTILLGILFLLSIVLWVVVILRLRRGHTLLDFQPRTEIPWGLIDIFLVFLLLPLVGSVANAIALAQLGFAPVDALDELPPNAMSAVLFAGSIAKLVVIGIALWAIRWKNGATWANLGWPSYSMRTDFLIGLAAFLMLVAPVLSIQAALVTFWPSEHPLIELLQENSGPVFFLVSGFSAVIVAPIAEEIIFRVLLQGWFEKLARYRGDPGELLIGRLRGLQEPGVTGQFQHDPSSTSNAERIEPTQTQETSVDSQSQADQVTTGSPTAVVASSMVFALMHYSHGPDPIPLFVFALGLGYLYQRTHRILPCIIVHFLLNALSLANLFLAS